jgi:hypothetical protein
MNSARHFGRHSSVAAMAALAITVAAWPAAAQQPPHPSIQFIAIGDHPPVPAGLQVVCVTVPDNGAPSATTCPVVKYKGITTWAYSYADNRTSMALVSYDSANNVVANVEKPGARYVFDALSSDYTKTVIFIGQAKNFVTATWDQLGPK